MIRSEKQKMLAGELYRPGDAEIQADAAATKEWLERFNASLAAGARCGGRRNRRRQPGPPSPVALGRFLIASYLAASGAAPRGPRSLARAMEMTGQNSMSSARVTMEPTSGFDQKIRMLPLEMSIAC